MAATYLFAGFPAMSSAAIPASVGLSAVSLPSNHSFLCLPIVCLFLLYHPQGLAIGSSYTFDGEADFYNWLNGSVLQVLLLSAGVLAGLSLPVMAHQAI